MFYESAIKDVMLTQVDSWQCQWMPDYPQIGHQESSCIKTKQDYDNLIYIKVTTGNKTEIIHLITSVTIISLSVLDWIQAVDERFTWSGFHLPETKHKITCFGLRGE